MSKEREIDPIILDEWIDDKHSRWPVFWKMILIVALNYEDKNRDQVVSFFSSLNSLIPCSECASHYKAKMLLMFPFFWTNRENIRSFVVNIYNTIELMNWRSVWYSFWDLLHKYLSREIDIQLQAYSDLQST